jgi:hypothetical protein
MEYTLELDNRQALAAQKKSRELPYCIFIIMFQNFLPSSSFSEKLLDF